MNSCFRAQGTLGAGSRPTVEWIAKVVGLLAIFGSSSELDVVRKWRAFANFQA
jgi:hypothetical protein